VGTASEDRRRRGRAPVALGGAAGAVLVAGAVVAACSALPARDTAARHRPPGSTTTTTAPGTGVVPTGRTAAPTVSLVSYGDCSALLARLKREALAEVGPYGLQAGGGPGAEGMPMRQAAPEGALAAPGAAASPGAASAGAASSSASSSAAAQDAAAPSSTTNDQEAGVDEPDLAKTDGHLMVVLRHDPVGLQVVDVTAPRTPHLDGFLGLSQLGSATGLFLAGSQAVVIGGSGGSPQAYSGTAGGPPGAVYPQPDSGTTATVVSLTDPKHPQVVRSFSLSGQEVDARQVDGRVLVVLQGSPRLPFTTPSDNSGAEQERALQHNRDVVSSSTLQEWLPSTTTQGSPGRQLPACPTVLHPSVASGMGTVSVVSLDPDSDAPGPDVTVVGNASVVYASTGAMYLATSSWSDQVAEGQGSTGATTNIHGFSLADPTAPRYLGSGSVPGVLTDQYALSEYGGVLRVATTVGQAYAPVPGAVSQDQQAAPADGTSDNLVTVLQPSGGALVPIGQISGLGRGERLYGVRFLGNLGYVVTFRQTDPLYVIDLSDPRHPALQGQLQLTGFSAYLHPLGGGRLLGLGQETDQGGDGVQVSVFDVSDPAHPALDARRYFDSSYSSAEHDPHQFLWWPGRGLAIIPVQQYAADQSFTGDIVLRVNPDGSLTEVGRISQPAPPRLQPGPVQPEPAQSGAASSAAAPAPPAGGTMMAPNYDTGIERALIVGDLIYTVSDGGVMASDIDSLDQVAWLPFTSGQ
jgi:hypothetical protein